MKAARRGEAQKLQKYEKYHPQSRPGRFHRAVYTNGNLIPCDKLEMSDFFFFSASVYVCVWSALMRLHQKDVFTAAAQPHVFQIN